MTFIISIGCKRSLLLAIVLAKTLCLIFTSLVFFQAS